jgi:hypothetical protein
VALTRHLLHEASLDANQPCTRQRVRPPRATWRRWKRSVIKPVGADGYKLKSVSKDKGLAFMPLPPGQLLVYYEFSITEGSAGADIKIGLGRDVGHTGYLPGLHIGKDLVSFSFVFLLPAVPEKFSRFQKIEMYKPVFFSPSSTGTYGYGSTNGFIFRGTESTQEQCECRVGGKGAAGAVGNGQLG